MIDYAVNIYLSPLFDWIIETSIMASILTVLILLVKTLLRNRLTPRWHYLLWMILIIRLLLPWSPNSSYSIYSILSYGYERIVSVQNPPIVSPESQPMQESKGMSGKKEAIGGEYYSPDTIPTPYKNTNVPNQIQKQVSNPISFHTISFYLWVMGIIFFSVGTYFVNRQIYQHSQKQPVISNNRIIDIFDRCKKSMSVQQDIPLLLAGKTSSPTVLGFFKPRILLPGEYINRLSDQQLRHIFYHELAHIKRRDVGLNWLMHVLLIMNWFNPILWWAYICMREDQELACDAYALTFMEEEEKILYGHTIIRLLEHYSNHFQMPSLANLSRNKRTIKRRITMIKNFGKKSYRWSALGVLTVVAVASLSLVNARANVSNKNQNPIITDQKNASVYVPPKQAENFKDMTKEDILTKMINTVDYFETATGEFKTHSESIPDDSIVEYSLSLRNKSGGFSKSNTIVNGKEMVNFQYYKDGLLWMIDEQSKTYMEQRYVVGQSSGKTLTIQEAFSVNKEGINVTKYRERPPVGLANESLFPYEIASNYTRDLNSWVIEKQNEELLGHNTLVIKGQKNRRDIQSFRFWVDKDTGILVKYEGYNADGKVVDYLYPTKLEINVPIDSNKFTPNLSGFTKKEKFNQNQPRITTGNIDTLIPDELKKQWEEAKKKLNETTILHLNDKWYIYAKKGYLVDRIEVNGKEGILYLAKTPQQKSEFTFHALAEGYKIDTLKIVYK